MASSLLSNTSNISVPGFPSRYVTTSVSKPGYLGELWHGISKELPAWWPRQFTHKIFYLTCHPVQSTTTGMQKLGTLRDSTWLTRKFSQPNYLKYSGDNYGTSEGKYHHKSFNPKEILSHTHRMKPNWYTSTHFCWETFSTRRRSITNQSSHLLVQSQEKTKQSSHNK